MQRLASGASTVITVPSGGTVTFAAGGSGVAVISSGQESGQTYKVGQTQTVIGPFPGYRLVSVSCVMGTLRYKASDPLVTAEIREQIALNQPRSGQFRSRTVGGTYYVGGTSTHQLRQHVPMGGMLVDVALAY